LPNHRLQPTRSSVRSAPVSRRGWAAALSATAGRKVTWSSGTIAASCIGGRRTTPPATSTSCSGPRCRAIPQRRPPRAS